MDATPHTSSYRAAVLSDLHLRAGHGDDFKFDAQFEALMARLGRQGCREVVFNGDVFDFVATRPEAPFHPDPELGLTERESVERLDGIAQAHPAFFEATRRFIRDGGRIVMLPGNHDWELHWPGIRQRITQLLGHPGADALQFVLHGRPHRPVPGLHIEHGHQLITDQNIFHHPESPLRPDPLGGPDRIEQTIGNWMVRCLVNRIERHFPFVNNVKPFMKIGWYGGLDIHAVRLTKILMEGARLIMRDARIPTRVKALVLNSPPFLRWRGPVSIPRFWLRPDHVLPRLAHAINDDSTLSLRHAARRHLQVYGGTRYVLMGHSHEVVDGAHEANRYFARHGRAYLNPGSWNPCIRVLKNEEPLNIDALCQGEWYPYKLAWVHIQGDQRDELEARVEVLEEDRVWMSTRDTT